MLLLLCCSPQNRRTGIVQVRVVRVVDVRASVSRLLGTVAAPARILPSRAACPRAPSIIRRLQLPACFTLGAATLLQINLRSMACLLTPPFAYASPTHARQPHYDCRTVSLISYSTWPGPGGSASGWWWKRHCKTPPAGILSFHAPAHHHCSSPNIAGDAFVLNPGLSHTACGPTGQRRKMLCDDARTCREALMEKR